VWDDCFGELTVMQNLWNFSNLPNEKGIIIEELKKKYSIL
jgi:hypothetical protein